MKPHITPTIGRVILYRGKDGGLRPAIVTQVFGEYCVNAHVFGNTTDDCEAGVKTSITHADPIDEPACFPSWHWMGFQLGQAQAQKSVPN